MKSKKVASALLAASVVATAVPAVAVQAAVTPAETAAKAALAKAEASLSQADWNAAVTAANKIADKNIKTWYLQKLFVVQRLVAAKNIRATVDKLKADGKVLDTTAQANLAKTFEAEATKVNSFVGLNAGLKTQILGVYFEEVKRVNAVNVVEAKAAAGTLTEAELAAEKAAVAKLVNTALRTELTTKLNAVKVTYELKVDKVSAVGTNKVKVTFNKPVEDTSKATFAVKRGAANYFTSVVWNTAKTEATVTTTIKLPEGDYSVEVAGLSATAFVKTLTVEAERVQDIGLTTSLLELKASSPFTYEVRNQYGEDMKISSSNVTALAYNVTQNKPHSLSTATGSKFTFAATFATKDDAQEAKLNDVIRLTLSYKGVTVTKDINVQAAISVSSIELGIVQPSAGKTLINVGDTGLTLPVAVKDQYGADVKLAATTQAATDDDTVTINGVTFLSSNESVIDIDTLAVDSDGKVTLTAGGTDGTATITAIVVATGKVSTTQVKVEKAATVGTLTLTQPTALVSAGETVKVPYAAQDQYGATINAKFNVHTANADSVVGVETIAINGVNLTFTSSDATIIDVDKITVDAKGELRVVTENKKGSATVTVKNGTTTVGTLTVEVQDAAVPTKIKEVVATKAIDTNLVQNKVVAIKAENFVILDQYNREYTLKASEAIVAWMADGSESYVDLGDQTSTYTKTAVDAQDANALLLTRDNSTAYLNVKGGATTGVEKVRFALTTNSASAYANLVSGSEFDVQFNNVSRPTSYTLATDKTSYTADEDVNVTITARKADGSVDLNYKQSGFATVQLDAITYNRSVTFVNGVATVTVPATTVNANYDVHVSYDSQTIEIGSNSDGDLAVTAGAFSTFSVTAGTDANDQVTLTAVDADGNTVSSYSGTKLANFKLTDKDGAREALGSVDAEGNLLVTFVSGVATDVIIDNGGVGTGDLTATDILTIVLDGKTVKKTL